MRKNVVQRVVKVLVLPETEGDTVNMIPHKTVAKGQTLLQGGQFLSHRGVVHCS